MMVHMSHRHAPLLTLLLALGTVPSLNVAEARVRLGDTLPAHPWQASAEASGREVVVVYSHDCGDLGALWQAVMDSDLPVRAVNAEGTPSPAPAGVNPWRGDGATAFARALKVSAYPTVLLVQGDRILNAWEGDFTGKLE
ncbi:penicillin-binding protein [Deinococcus frigens]